MSEMTHNEQILVKCLKELRSLIGVDIQRKDIQEAAGNARVSLINYALYFCELHDNQICLEEVKENDR